MGPGGAVPWALVWPPPEPRWVRSLGIGGVLPWALMGLSPGPWWGPSLLWALVGPLPWALESLQVVKKLYFQRPQAFAISKLTGPLAHGV